MIVGRFVDSYATQTPLQKYQACVKSCPWWNPLCVNGCAIQEGIPVAANQAGHAAGSAINTGLQNIGQQLGAGIGANAGTLTPALTMLGIAAVGIIAVIMVIR
jgi:hypothetical protein